ncbi:hypothetical protein I316_07679 [Kwoniella heveanensis BCC8398]|uniref:Uncharacterized protein n=1 Tax=Kwoniella heveanensis BCC8398 TaxID=1296120 RepID=A0A1B9GIA6_9TREE|nr:hypothetical protein I316_07679 [Kwoniella heveanensis BCC8398]
MRSHFFILIACFIVLLATFSSVADAAYLPTKTRDNRLTSRGGEKLTNAQRIARGLPLNKPKRMFDAKLRPRAPVPS